LTNHAKLHRRYLDSAADARWSGLAFRRVRSRREAQILVDSASER
jgi:hypothetical protein